MSSRRVKKRGRKSGKYYTDVKSKIMTTLSRYPGASTHEVAERAKIGWATSDRYLKKLEREKKVSKRKVGRRTAWKKR